MPRSARARSSRCRTAARSSSASTTTGSTRPICRDHSGTTRRATPGPRSARRGSSSASQRSVALFLEGVPNLNGSVAAPLPDGRVLVAGGFSSDRVHPGRRVGVPRKRANGCSAATTTRRRVPGPMRPRCPHRRRAEGPLHWLTGRCSRLEAAPMGRTIGSCHAIEIHSVVRDPQAAIRRTTALNRSTFLSPAKHTM